MKTILYVFSLVWLLTGLGVLVGGQSFGLGALQGGATTVPGGTLADTAGISWFWFWTFPMPSLLAGALGAVLGRLDAIRDAIDFANERDAPDDSHPVPEERMDPYIGESYLATPTTTKPTSSKRDPTVS